MKETNLQTDISLLTGFHASRQKRQIIKQFRPCSNSALLEVLADCPSVPWNLNCRIKTGTCYYIVTCERQRTKQFNWKCKTNHIRNAMFSCCDYTCPSKKKRVKIRVGYHGVRIGYRVSQIRMI